MVCLLLVSGSTATARQDVVQGKKVLVVASYHPGYRWVDDIVSSLRESLQGARFTVFYMDTKRNLENAAAKAEEAFALYRKIQPDAVITIDDNAQKYFVVPYLKDKVATPVVFCGVNDDASKYGFPAGNVTGVLEKKHYREGISFARVIDQDIQNIVVLYRKSPSNDTNLAQIEKGKRTYAAAVVESVEVSTLAEALQAASRLESKAEALLLLNLTGITDENGNQMEGHDVIAAVVEQTKLVTIGASDWEIEAGALCGVIKSGEEQGSLAADQLVSIWQGKSVSDLPLTENKNGRRFLNVTTLKKLNRTLTPEVIIGTRIIRSK
jgi:ABC-type uncharacterized transport system substrate-binding protein